MRGVALLYLFILCGLTAIAVLPVGKVDLAQLKAFEWPNSYNLDDDCKTQWLHFTNVNYCLRTYPDRPPQVALLGDSHANMYFKGLGLHYANLGENMVMMGKGGCAPFLDLKGPRGDQLRDQCEGIVNDVLNFVIFRESIHTVILTSRSPWNFNVTDEEFSGEYLRALRRTLERLTATKRVVFILDIPALGFDPRSCVKTRPLTWKEVRAPCSVHRDSMTSYQAAILKVLTDFPMVKVYDPTAALCDSTTCYAMKSGKMLYRDENHLSAEGSHWVVERMFGSSPAAN